MLYKGTRASIIALTALTFVPSILRCQTTTPASGRRSIGANAEVIQNQNWHISGKVTDLAGKPLHAASVRVDIGYGPKFVKDVTTDLRGEFETDYTLDPSTATSLSVKLLVESEGFLPAHEIADFGKGDKTWEVDVAMRPEAGDSGVLRLESLIETLAPKLRARIEKDAALAPACQDFERGAGEFLDQHDSVKAIESLTKVVNRFPACSECLTMLGLALLDSGSWRGATNAFADASKLVSAQENKEDQAESLLISGELENWKGERDKAADFLVKANDLKPQDAFILQELGRTRVLQKNWEAADEYLKRALAAGAGKEAVLLRTQAQLEEGDAEAAKVSMKEFLGGASVRTFPASVRRLNALIDFRLDLRSYCKVKSVVTEPLAELIKGLPELQSLDPAKGIEDVAAILNKAGEDVQAFFGNFQNTASEERVREERLNKDGKVKQSLDQRFQYLLVARPEQWGLGLEEFRTDAHGNQAAPEGLNSGLMLTSGFASASVLFHPAYQSGATFRYLGKQSFNGRDCFVVAFAQKPEKAQTVERFNVNGNSVLILFQGLAWIDAQNYKVVRLRTDLLKPQPQIRLNRQTTEISYDRVTFKEMSAEMWLPREVAVTVEWEGRTYRNMHKYLDFKLFHTESKQKMEKVISPPKN